MVTECWRRGCIFIWGIQRSPHREIKGQRTEQNKYLGKENSKKMEEQRWKTRAGLTGSGRVPKCGWGRGREGEAGTRRPEHEDVTRHWPLTLGMGSLPGCGRARRRAQCCRSSDRAWLTVLQADWGRALAEIPSPRQMCQQRHQKRRERPPPSRILEARRCRLSWHRRLSPDYSVSQKPRFPLLSCND